jgi:hypothetical protein
MHLGHHRPTNLEPRRYPKAVRDQDLNDLHGATFTFTGKEDPNIHLQAFVQLCQTFNMDGVTQDQLRARLFPFSLLRKDLQWFYSKPAETVQDWDALMRAFMKEYYSPGKTQSLRNKIATFA